MKENPPEDSLEEEKSEERIPWWVQYPWADSIEEVWDEIDEQSNVIDPD
jgi:hypothetical protein